MGSISLDLRSLVLWSVHFQKLKSSSQSQFHIVSQVLGFVNNASSRLETKPLRLSLVQIGELGPKLCVCRAVWTTQRVG